MSWCWNVICVFLCQKRRKKGRDNERLSKSTKDGISKIIDVTVKKTCLDDKDCTIMRIEKHLFNDQTVEPAWHRSCF